MRLICSFILQIVMCAVLLLDWYTAAWYISKNLYFQKQTLLCFWHSVAIKFILRKWDRKTLQILDITLTETLMKVFQIWYVVSYLGEITLKLNENVNENETWCELFPRILCASYMSSCEWYISALPANYRPPNLLWEIGHSDTRAAIVLCHMHRSAVPDIWNTDFDGLVLKWLLKNCEFILKSLLLV